MADRDPRPLSRTGAEWPWKTAYPWGPAPGKRFAQGNWPLHTKTMAGASRRFNRAVAIAGEHIRRQAAADLRRVRSLLRDR